MGTCILLFMIIERKWKWLCETNKINLSQSIERGFSSLSLQNCIIFCKEKDESLPGVKRKKIDS